MGGGNFLGGLTQAIGGLAQGGGLGGIMQAFQGLMGQVTGAVDAIKGLFGGNKPEAPAGGAAAADNAAQAAGGQENNALSQITKFLETLTGALKPQGG